MPFYISKTSLQDRYSEERVTFAADDDADGQLDPNKVSDAIGDAEAEINSYLASAYTLPLPGVTDREDPEANTSVPPELRRVAVDIAMYRMVPEHDRLTKERRRRYDDAVKWLEKVACKKVQLTVSGAATASKISRYGPDRIFTREKTDGLV